MQLVTNYRVYLPGQCLVSWPEGEDIRFSCTVGEFDAVIKLEIEVPGRSKGPDDKYYTYILKEALVQVSREEEEAPPTVPPNEEGRRDYSIQKEYFDKRRPDYGAASREAINRLIRFFKYRLNTPYLTETSYDVVQSNVWTDGSGSEVGKSGYVIAVRSAPGEWGELGVRKLDPGLEEAVHKALQDPIVPALYEEILSDAQTALFERNIKRAVLELAIACEILVKRKYFSEDTPAGAAFDYLEDQSRVRVRVLDLIDRIALEAFGRSFRVEQNDNYQNIDHLFRCRNKVAHRGELSYRDDSANKVEVDSEVVSIWWNSVLALIDWIEDL